VDRASWKAFIKLSLVSIPVQGYSAAKPEREQITLHQLHQGHARIQYRKVCPVHGEVPNDEIVKGYEYSKGEYVVVDPKEIEKAQERGDRAIEIRAFVPPQEIDPLYYSGKSYYLKPDGPAGEKAYALLEAAMAHEKVYGLASVVLGARQELVVLRPVQHVLTMSGLQYESQLRNVSEFSEKEHRGLPSKELRLVETLIEATAQKHFDASKFHDEYQDKLRKLVEAKAEGKEISIIPDQEPRAVINLMDALRKSVAQAKESPRRKDSLARRTAGTKQSARSRTARGRPGVAKRA
jgi:DNA end-binding protein Ku